MSAIFGILRFDGVPADDGALARMGAALAADGPDGHGAWASGSVALGQRLMCFTPEDRYEKQPLVAAGGNLVLAFDGRLDNRPDLHVPFGMNDDEARTCPDSALVLRAYERWGEDCLDKLIGDFTFALWNGQRQRLVAGRSAPIGRPFHYHVTGDRLVFASRPRGLFALPDVRRRVDEDRVARLMTVAGAAGQQSFFRDIQMLKPGQLLVAGADGIAVRQWWSPDFDRDLGLRRDDDYAAALDALLQRVIASHLRSEGNVGIFVSGGLDSSSVAALAAPQLAASNRILHAYTEVPPLSFARPLAPGQYADETPLVRALAATLPGLDLQLIAPDGRGPLDDVERLFAYAEMPVPDAFNRLWGEAILEQAGAAGVRVMLDGGQGNLTVSYDGAGLLPELLRKRRWRRALAAARGHVRGGRARSAWRALLSAGVLPLAPAPIDRAARSLRTMTRPKVKFAGQPLSLISPEFAAACGLSDRLNAAAQASARNVLRDSRGQRARVILATEASGGEIKAGYRAMFGIESRSPLADRRIVEFCLAVPEEQYACDGETRFLIRRAMKERLPHEILSNRARGLQAAWWYDAMSRDRQRLLARVADFERSELTRKILDLPRLRSLLEDWPSPEAIVQPRAGRLYRGGMGMAMMVGSFLLWAQKV